MVVGAPLLIPWIALAFAGGESCEVLAPWVPDARGGLPDARVEALIDDGASLHLRTPSGWFRWDGRRFWPSRDPAEALAIPGEVRDVAFHAGRWWAATDGGALRRDDGAWVVVDPSPARALRPALGRPNPWVVRDDGSTWEAGGAHLDPGEIAGVAAAPEGALWLAARGDGLLRAAGGVTTPWWAPPEPATDLTAAGDSLFVAAGGLWRLTQGEPPLQLGLADGVPERVAITRPGPAGKAWVAGPDGVAQVHPDGPATPLPVAPLARGVAVRAIAPFGRGALVGTDRGLEWVGPGEPGGFSRLVAAARPPIDDVLGSREGLFALSDGVVHHLRDGELTRIDLHQPAVDLAEIPRGVVAVGPVGAQYWVRGARLPTPVDRGHPGSRVVSWIGGHAILDGDVLRAPGADLRLDQRVDDVIVGSSGTFVLADGALRTLSSAGEVGDPLTRADVVGSGPAGMWGIAAADGDLPGVVWSVPGAPQGARWACGRVDVIAVGARDVWAGGPGGLYHLAVP